MNCLSGSSRRRSWRWRLCYGNERRATSDRGVRDELVHLAHELACVLATGGVCSQACQLSGVAAAHVMLAKLLIALIRVYQATLSKLLFAAFGPVCRFEPSCSRYAAACIAGQGALRGSLLSAKRLCKCHPFHPGGYDPPPPPRLGRSVESVQSAVSSTAHGSAVDASQNRIHSPDQAGVLPSE